MRLGWFLLLVLSASLAADPVPLPLAVPADVYRDYECWLGKRTLANITDYHGPCLRRDVVDVALFQQALIAAGYAHDPQWEIINSYQRTLLELSRGKLPAAATSLWLKDIEATPGLAASDAVLPVGSNLAQLYGRETVAGNTPLTQLQQLAQYRIVSSSQWDTDWQLLQTLPHAELLDANHWMTMVRWVNHGRADLLLAPPLQHGRQHLTVDAVMLAPLPGGMLCLPGSRHFAISRQWPEAVLLQQALDRGLSILKREGRVQQAYHQAGLMLEASPLNACE
ncbi:MAG: hypothetical protein VX920_05045 [Pseudomonadota bacterium]|nr:hypothetical protein [Pseudomonadota bacterium]